MYSFLQPPYKLLERQFEESSKDFAELKQSIVGKLLLFNCMFTNSVGLPMVYSVAISMVQTRVKMLRYPVAFCKRLRKTMYMVPLDCK